MALRKNFRMIAKTLPGLEDLLASELNDIGAQNIQKLIRGVEFSGDQSVMYAANYICRTAIRILKPIAVFRVHNEMELYEQVKQIAWPSFFKPNQTFMVDAGVHNASIRHSRFAALKTKDAIADRFREQLGKRPSVDIEKPDMVINMHLNKSDCTISLDSSSPILYKRGYRTDTGPAPLNEVLAAGMILLSGWDKKSPFVDPMCGSGTLPIEAAMIAHGIPAGFYRKKFGFMKWNDYDAELWQKIRKEAGKMPSKKLCEITGSDISKEAVQIARRNLLNTGFESWIKLRNESIGKFNPPSGGGVMICNPPYGERLHENNLVHLYREIGDALKKKYIGYKAWIISSDMTALKNIGLKPSGKIILYNGQLECRFVRFEIYEGSRKGKYQFKVQR